MMDRIAQIVLIILGILVLALLVIGLSSSCRVRPVPDSVTPVVSTSIPNATSTPGQGLPSEGTAINQPTPTPFLDTGLPTATSTSSSGGDQTEIPQATETMIPTQPTTNPMETPFAPETTPSPSNQVDGGGQSSFVPGTTVQHQVGQGEWLMQIARCYGTTYEAVRAANRLAYPDLILPGTVMAVPSVGSNGRIIGPPCVLTHTVQTGENWETLAGRFGTTAVILQKANPGGLFEGRSIWVPRNN